jgi:hypothetical protein
VVFTDGLDLHPLFEHIDLLLEAGDLHHHFLRELPLGVITNSFALCLF